MAFQWRFEVKLSPPSRMSDGLISEGTRRSLRRRWRMPRQGSTECYFESIALKCRVRSRSSPTASTYTWYTNEEVSCWKMNSELRSRVKKMPRNIPSEAVPSRSVHNMDPPSIWYK
ncbi:uncharacterized protein LOC121431615 [Lytechinus variegatus]|uniref:uncharacterized protein LOC121431242 n=1 Tax=Lytechinus variegatus TaxID=7654 RepID=UPI001BB27497|nr:uncharacterized protein LOC121431242 [Lytechinus variegatus]XP_041485122.1 uncharacterized protein LOC121431615 [Lytechinus variegatus]